MSETGDTAAKGKTVSTIDLAGWLVTHEWYVLEHARHLKQDSEPQPAELALFPAGTGLVDVVAMHIPDDLWDLLARVVNRNIMAERGCESADTRRRDTTAAEMKVWYGTQMLLETTHGNSVHSLPKHFKAIVATHGAGTIGCDRWQRIKDALQPTSDELKRIASLLESKARKQVHNVAIVTVDETVVGYRPSHASREKARLTGHAIPLVYIKRKPHPNGLEIFLGCTYVKTQFTRKGLPFVVSFVPHLVTSGHSCGDIAREMIDTWDGDIGQPHWVLDAAFGSDDLVDYAKERGYRMTVSVSQGRIPTLWQSLSRSLPTDHWRAAVNTRTGMVASVHCGKTDGAHEYQCILSSNYSVGKEVQLTKGVVEDAEEESNEQAAAAAVATTTTHERETSGDEDGSSEDGNDMEDVPERYQPAVVAKCKGAELRAMCSELHIKPSRVDQMRKNIIAEVKLRYRKRTEVEKLEAHLKSHGFQGAGDAHVFYKNHFNWVDLANRTWYSVEEHHHHRHWEFKYLIALLRFAMHNSIVHIQYCFDSISRRALKKNSIDYRTEIALLLRGKIKEARKAKSDVSAIGAPGKKRQKTA